MTDPPVYLVGLSEPKHPGGARYVGFRRHLPASFVPAPLSVRYFAGARGRKVDGCVNLWTGHPGNSLGLFLMEASAGLHMLPRRCAVYHAVRADIDIHYLPRLARQTGNFVVGTFHEPPGVLKGYMVEERLADLHGAILLGTCQRSYFERFLDPARIFVVHHGVDANFFHPAPSPVNEPVLITVGAYMRDADTLGKAMPLIWNEEPRARLVAVGTAREGYWQRPPPLVDERLTLLDRINDLELLRAYQSASIAVLSVDEAVANNALLEYLACGLPIVASDVGAVHEYLGDAAGLLVPPSDPEALAASALRLLRDQALRRRMGAAARSRGLGFDNRTVAERLRGVYRKVRALGQPPRR
jgi:glycosyltransferase involved in cell wall biosynthesis